LTERVEQAGLNRAWIAAEAALPLEWRIEGLTCASEGLQPEQRSDRWRAWATGPKGERIEGEGERPVDPAKDTGVSNLQVVQRFAKALSEEDFDTQDALIHDDYILEYPQSGERIRGRTNRRAIMESYPSRAEAGMPTSVGRIIGTDDTRAGAAAGVAERLQEQ
jgi:limonene-1,2-epoxide hydrolase